MPVPDSYSRRYGREETTYSSSYSTRGTRSSYLYSSSKQSTSLPPRPPSLYGSSDAYRKYDTSSATSRYLNSTTGTTSRLRDYGSSSSTGGATPGAGGYRSSVSPVRATSALRTSLADRLKAMEIESKDDDPPIRTYSRYTPLRSREPVTSSISTRAYTSTYGNRDRSNSREYGVSPLASSNLSSSYRERDPSGTRSSSENLKKRSSPSPTASSVGASSRKDSTDSGAAVPAPSSAASNGQSSTEVNKSSSTSSSTCDSATCRAKGVVDTTHITSQKPLVTTSCATTTTHNSLVTVDSINNASVDEIANADVSPPVIESSRCAYTRCARDLENNDLVSDSRSYSPPGTISLRIGSEPRATTSIAVSQDTGSGGVSGNSNAQGMVKKMSNGNSSDDDGGSNKDGVLVMVVQDRISSNKVKSVPSSSSSTLKDSLGGSAITTPTRGVDDSGGGGVGVEHALGSSSSLSSASESAFSSANIVKVMEKDSNGNPISMEAKPGVDEIPAGAGVKVMYGKGEEKDLRGKTTSSAVKVGVTSRRRRESDSNANNLVENGKDEGRSSIEEGHKISIKVNREGSPNETYTVTKPRRSSTTPSSSGGLAQNPSSSSSSLSTSRSRVIYHTIKVEDASNKSPSPEPVTYTVKAPSSSSSSSSSMSSGAEPAKVSTETSAEFKVSLPRRRSSAVKVNDLPSSSAPAGGNDNRHRNGNVDPGDTTDDSNNQKKLNSSSRETNSPSKSSVMSHSVRSNRKSASPASVKVVTNHHTSSLKTEEDSSSSVDDEQSDYDKRVRRPASVSTSTTTTSSKSSAAASSSAGVRKSKSKSPAPRSSLSKRSEVSSIPTSGQSKLSSDDVANVNGPEMGGPHTSKFAYEPSQTEHSSGFNSNRNDRTSRYAHLSGASAAIASDSSDNDDAFSSSPQPVGRNRASNERAGLTGLRNIGNTCFMNTVVQCLSNTKPLLEFVVQNNYASDINTSTSAMKGCLMRAFAEVIQELWREQRVVDTSAFKDQIQKFAPRFMGYNQQDAQEFLRYLLEGLHEDVNRVTAKPTPILTDIEDSLSDSQKATEAWKRYLRYENSRVVDIFVGQLRSTLKCTVCGNCSVTFDPFWDLSLPIPARTSQTRLSQCFEHFTKEEVLDGDEKPTCSKCQCRRKCTKSFSIQKFPRILVIHLKRFSPMERYRGKLSTLVEYPLNSLDLSPYAANRGQAVTYNLYGVANHSGSTYSGHYIAYCKHPYSGEWHCYNDSRVSPISSHQVISTEGYVLFYEQSS